MIRALRRLLLLSPVATLVVAACSGGASGPVAGTWAFVNGEVTVQTCGDVIPIEVASGDFTIAVVDDAAFTVDPGDGADPFTCDLDGDDFSCPERLQEKIKVASFDATLLVHVTAAGAFTSERAASGRQDATISCTGEACPQAEFYAKTTFPCEVSAAFTASAK